MKKEKKHKDIDNIISDLNKCLGIKKVSLIKLNDEMFILNDKYIIKCNCKFYELYFNSIFKNKKMKYKIYKYDKTKNKQISDKI